MGTWTPRWGQVPERQGGLGGTRAVSQSSSMEQRTPVQKDPGHWWSRDPLPESKCAQAVKKEKPTEPEHVRRFSTLLKNERNANCSYSENTVVFIFQMAQTPKSLVAHFRRGRAFGRACQCLGWREHKSVPTPGAGWTGSSGTTGRLSDLRL